MQIKKKPKRRKLVLDKEEKSIERALVKGKYKRAKNAKEKLAKARKAASTYLRKDKQINIRISTQDLLRIRKMAAHQGLPYQTFLASIIHKVSTGQTVRF